MYSNSYNPNFNSKYKSNVSWDNWYASQDNEWHLASYLIPEIEPETEVKYL